MRRQDAEPEPTPLSTRLRGHLELSRISNGPTVVTNVVAAATLAGASPADPAIAGLAVAMVLVYVAGMYLNDVFDYAVDRRHRPERPLVSGVVSRPRATGWAVAYLTMALLIV
ncbi:MAG: UbiA family prenyltransferase, partial [Bradymonadaceae bacterium]